MVHFGRTRHDLTELQNHVASIKARLDQVRARYEHDIAAGRDLFSFVLVQDEWPEGYDAEARRAGQRSAGRAA
jgi:hypothetical protein